MKFNQQEGSRQPEAFQNETPAIADKNESFPTSVSVRDHLVEAVRLDLVGPWHGHPLAEERLRRQHKPSNWYLTGFLMPADTPDEDASSASDEDEQDEIGIEPGDVGSGDETAEERKAAKRAFFPSSIGLSFLVPEGTHSLDVRVRWGDYEYREVQGPDDAKPTEVWQRIPREEALHVDLHGPAERPTIHPVPSSEGLQLQVLERELPADGLRDQIPIGTVSVSVFLVNQRRPNHDKRDLAFAFQPEIEVQATHAFVPRPDLRGASAEEWDDRVADLHYADTPEYATGHGVAADWDRVDGVCHAVRTAWIPVADIEKTETQAVPGVELDMDVLGQLEGGEAGRRALSPLVDQYREWLDEQETLHQHLTGERREVAKQLLHLARAASNRIENGIATLSNDEEALEAFRVANRAVSRALKTRLDLESPRWRAFQLAFVLLNLEGMANPASEDREIVDLLFFPTGGGKTEAYLGLAAFAMVLRRLRNTDEQGGRTGAGVSVIMRYTLRLLTLDQLGRAAGLVCALELERKEDVGRYGEWPFEIGLWVGKAATPNQLGEKGDKRDDTARSKVNRFKQEPRRRPSPIPLENCPWCGTKFEPHSFHLRPDADKPRELIISCTNFECDFSGDGALPIVAVDESLYRRLPAFLIATVDKFAALPWTGPSGVLLGGADRASDSGFYGPADPGVGTKLARPLPPPDLIIQDELHLISGPLGTMAGLYETAIEALTVRETEAGKTVRPKIVASTATARRAATQVQALFARGTTQVFPPPGPDRRDSFFARVVPSSEKNARQYLGIAAQGRNPKVVMRRVYLALMAAAEHAYREAGGHHLTDNPADPYMTVLGYFNSLRELGGARRILEEEVQHTVKEYGGRTRYGSDLRLFRDRRRLSEVLELTSRVPTNEVSNAKRRLDLTFDEKERVDYAIATNMISVGLDIPRLGLMVVLGQPKTNAEYIQATSRVGRDDERPGLVVTLLNIHKPRDRSHYERFRHYHETFYRNVEASSVTPFAARALDRGFAGALVALARHLYAQLTPSRGASGVQDVRTDLEARLYDIFAHRIRRQPFVEEEERDSILHDLQSRIGDLLDAWVQIEADHGKEGLPTHYQKYEKRGTPAAATLLREMLDADEDPVARKFRVNRSLRDVEPEVHLWIKDLYRYRDAGSEA